jgi:hypothetical protein
MDGTLAFRANMWAAVIGRGFWHVSDQSSCSEACVPIPAPTASSTLYFLPQSSSRYNVQRWRIGEADEFSAFVGLNVFRASPWSELDFAFFLVSPVSSWPAHLADGTWWWWWRTYPLLAMSTITRMG